MKRALVQLILWMVVALTVSSQSRKPELSGYIGVMPSAIFQLPSANATWQGLLHNRINFGWQWASAWRADVGLRNRLIVDEHGGTKFKPTFDRLFLTFEHQKWRVQVGRQRINWGQTLVWNPNDLFNTYSFFDFDYPERPGSDGMRLTYFHNETSSSELAATMDDNRQITAALLHHWNYRGFDYQLLFGELAEDDLVFGGAWSGSFGGLNFRGEASYFLPMSEGKDILACSVGFDYMFSNSLMLQTEVLYNNAAGDTSGSGLLGMYDAPLSAKRLSICQWNIFGQGSYPLSSRLNGSLSGIWFADIEACYAGLSLDFSLSDNLDLSAFMQYFVSASSSDLGKMNVLMAFARLKWSF